MLNLNHMPELQPEVAQLLQVLVSMGAVYKVTDYLKKWIPSKYAPVLATSLGVAIGLVLVTWIGGATVLQGLMAGLAIAGFTVTGYDIHKGLTK